MSLATIYLQSAIKRISYYKELGDKTFTQLEEKDLHFQPTPESNSIAVIIQHIAGNMLSRWTDFLDSDGEKEWRNRDSEFEEQPLSKDGLIAYWEKGWNCMLTTLQGLQEDDLTKTITIRAEKLPAVDAINRQLAHYPYHVGQIVYLGRMIRGESWKNLSIAKGKSDEFNKGMMSR
ncbi:MAG TPA: DUF1572 family protein [Ferruginibacter sp.]|nr:DUF1572 family protein [Ferruginibacter sp.]